MAVTKLRKIIKPAPEKKITISPEIEAEVQRLKMLELYNSSLKEIENLEKVIQCYRDLFPSFLSINQGVYIGSKVISAIKKFDKGWIPVVKFDKVFKDG